MNDNCCCLILNYNDYDNCKRLYDDIKDYTEINKILIVDNCSTDSSYDQLKCLETEKLTVLRTAKNGGYGAGNNFGMSYIKENFKCDIVLLVNPDVFFSEILVGKLKKALVDNNAAAVSAWQKNINGEIVSNSCWKVPALMETVLWYTGTGIRLFNVIYKKDYFKDKKIVEVDCIQGSLVMYDLDKFLSVGGYDEEMFLYWEESTIGFKLKKANMKTYMICDDSYIHQHGGSINKALSVNKTRLKILFDSKNIYLKKYLKANWFLQKISLGIEKRVINKQC